MGSYTQYAMSKSYPTRQRLYGSDDFFDSALIKSNVLIMGSCELNGKHDIFMAKGRNVYTFTGMIGRLSASGGERQRSWIYT
jgi:hypothetical protein